MRGDFKAVVWRLAAFLVVCLVGTFVLLTVFAQFRFGQDRTYNAEFTNVSGLKTGDKVRIAGVEVGKVKDIAVRRDATVAVAFATDNTVVLTQGSRAAIRYDNLFGGRYLALEQGPGAVNALPAGGTIPVARTQPALDLDSLIGGFRPLFRALNPDQVNQLSGQLIQILQGQGPSIGSFLDQAAAVSNTLADRDKLIGQVVENLNVILGSIGNQSDRFDKAVESLSELVDGLAARKTDVTNAIGYTNAAAGALTDLLARSRPPFQKMIHETDRVSAIAVADHDYLDNLLNTLPDKYRTLARQGMYGDFFSFYLCEIVLKVNGKGGQPVYVKLAGQDSGRCTPK